MVSKRLDVLQRVRYRAALAAGAYDRRPMFARLAGDGVVWADGVVEPVDVVLLATGYRPSLGYLAGTGALGPDGAPLHRSGESRTLPGLAYVGLEFQRSFRSATVRGVGADARRVVERLTSASRRQMTGRPRRRRRVLAAVREEGNGPAGRGAGGPAVQQGRP
jgi:putative flavoprotein involved in K+ transport